MPKHVMIGIYVAPDAVRKDYEHDALDKLGDRFTEDDIEIVGLINRAVPYASSPLQQLLVHIWTEEDDPDDTTTILWVRDQLNSRYDPDDVEIFGVLTTKERA